MNVLAAIPQHVRLGYPDRTHLNASHKKGLAESGNMREPVDLLQLIHVLRLLKPSVCDGRRSAKQTLSSLASSAHYHHLPCHT
jgi:hypothetical protein